MDMLHRWEDTHPMPTNTSRAPAGRGKPRRLLAAAMLAAAVAALALLGGCAAVPGPAAQAQSLDDAVASLTAALFAGARLDPSEPRVLVVDPLIDRATGNRAAVTRAMEPRMIEAVRERFPHVRPAAFTQEAVERRPLVLVGSITPVAAPGAIAPSTDGPPRVYRIWASLADLRTGKILAKEMAWVRAGNVDMTPTRFFRDSPVWAADRAMQAYLKTCAGNPGEDIDPAYLNGLKAAVATDDGIRAYEDGRYLEALASYTQASMLPGGDQVRVRNGAYLTNVALGRPRAAEEAFGRMVDAGLSRGKLAVKFVFRPASTQFWPDRAISGHYPVWLRQIARRGAERGTCLLVLGHASPTGAPALNDALSERRAGVVRAELVRREAMLEERTQALGRGSREPLVGSGRDDVTDALDRRVEFDPRPCGTVRAERAPGRG